MNKFILEVELHSELDLHILRDRIGHLMKMLLDYKFTTNNPMKAKITEYKEIVDHGTHLEGYEHGSCYSFGIETYPFNEGQYKDQETDKEHSVDCQCDVCIYGVKKE